MNVMAVNMGENIRYAIVFTCVIMLDFATNGRGLSNFSKISMFHS